MFFSKSILIVALLVAVVQRGLTYQYINCDLDNEKNDVYVYKNAIYRCRELAEVVDYCTHCNGNNGGMIDIDTLKNVYYGFQNADNEKRAGYCNAKQQCRPASNFIADLCELTVTGAKIFVYPNEDGDVSQTKCDRANGVHGIYGNNGYPSYRSPYNVPATTLPTRRRHQTPKNDRTYKYINCNKREEKYNIYVDGNSVFRCNGLVETFEYCIVCDGNDIFRGQLVSMNDLRKYAPNIKYGNETIQMQYCNIHMDRLSLPNGKSLNPAVHLCTLTVDGATIRRYKNDEVSTKECTRSDS